MKRHAARIVLPLAFLLAVVAACTTPVQGGGPGAPAAGTPAAGTPAPTLNRYNY